jgi:hypothetical protein
VKGVALSTTSNWLWNFVIGVHHSYMVVTDEGKLGAKVFFILGATCTASALSAYVFAPETKGLSLEQVDRTMEEVSPRNIVKWVPHNTYT